MVLFFVPSAASFMSMFVNNTIAFTACSKFMNCFMQIDVYIAKGYLQPVKTNIYFTFE